MNKATDTIRRKILLGAALLGIAAIVTAGVISINKTGEENPVEPYVDLNSVKNLPDLVVNDPRLTPVPTGLSSQETPGSTAADPNPSGDTSEMAQGNENGQDTNLSQQAALGENGETGKSDVAGNTDLPGISGEENPAGAADNGKEPGMLTASGGSDANAGQAHQGISGSSGTNAGESQQTASGGMETELGQMVQTGEEEMTAVLSPQVVAESLTFQKSQGLLWPLSGAVVIPYSPDHGVYYKTLDHFSTSDAVILSSEVGTPVYAAAKGVVVSIEENVRTGTTVKLGLGNNTWLVYGQLSVTDLKEGDVLEEGDCIGTVAEPTRYYVVEGPNLYFQVLEGEESVNPMMLLRGEEEMEDTDVSKKD